MLLRFAVSNHLSIKSREEISFVGTTLKDERGSQIEVAEWPDAAILPVALLYGANASGKSNLVSAIQWMRQAVRLSHKEGQPGSRVPRRPFLLDRKTRKEPTSFEMDFILAGKRYHYRFSATDEAFVAEDLFVYETQRPRMLFEREGQNVRFGRSLRGRNAVIASLMRPNSLFVSVAAQNGHEELTEVSRFFSSIDVETSIAIDDAEIRFYGREIDKRAIEFLGRIGTGVVGVERSKVEDADELRDYRERVTDLLAEAHSSDTVARVKELMDSRMDLSLRHGGLQGESFSIEFRDESAGTRRLLMLLSAAFDALDAGSILVIDELDASLHTQAAEAFLALFTTKSINRHGAQLLATTHDTNLMSSRLLRRDQLWLCEKDAGGASHFYSVSDFQVRRTDNIERGYLQGRFGALPFAGPLEGLLD